MTSVFLDTSAFIALVDRGDRNHAAAKRFLRKLSQGRRPLVSSTYILDEALTLLRMRVGHQAAVRLGEELNRTNWCRVLDITEDLRLAAWQIFVRYDDQLFSFTDCTSFALMHAMKLDEAFSFDRRDFGAAGFTALPAS